MTEYRIVRDPAIGDWRVFKAVSESNFRIVVDELSGISSGTPISAAILRDFLPSISTNPEQDFVSHVSAFNDAFVIPKLAALQHNWTISGAQIENWIKARMAEGVKL